MSAPRSVWLSEDAVEYFTTRIGSDTRLYHLIPADPDGPMPGETWMWCGVKVEIVGPSRIGDNGLVSSWRVRSPSGWTYFALTDSLTRIPEPPEHEEWCERRRCGCGKPDDVCYCSNNLYATCTCERRKGERRKDRRRKPDCFGRRLRVIGRRASDTEGGR